MMIFHFFRNLKYGGCQKMALNLIRQLPQYKHHIIYLNEESVDIDSMKKEFDTVTDSITYLSQNQYSIKEISSNINKLCNVNEKSIFLSWFYPFSLKLKLSNNFNIVNHIGTAPPSYTNLQYWKNNINFVRFKSKRGQNNIFASNHIYLSYKNKYIFSPKNETIIHNGINTDDFSFKRVSHSEYSKKIGMVGRLDGSKDFDSFIKLASELKNKDKDLSFFIAGDGVEKDRLFALNKKFGSPCVFLGNIHNMKNFYQMIDILVFFNKDIEGFGLVLVEAMLSGVIVLSNNKGASKEIINNSVDGFLVDHVNDAIKIINGIYQGKYDIEAVVNNAFLKASKDFSSRKCAMKYADVFKNLLDN